MVLALTQAEFTWLVSHLSCPVCGASMPTRYPNGKPRFLSNGVPRFCSKTCTARYHFREKYAAGFGVRPGQARHNIRGENHPRWKGGVSRLRCSEMTRVEYRQWRNGVYERDDYTCQSCGARGGRLHAHHIKSYADHPDLRLDDDNGITLCESCHRDVHRSHAH